MEMTDRDDHGGYEGLNAAEKGCTTNNGSSLSSGSQKKGTKSKPDKPPKYSIFNAVFQGITCCLPNWARYFIINVYRASIPESIWFEDVNILPHFWKNLITLTYNAAYFGVFFYFVKTSYDSNRTTYFVSLDPGAGECQEIGRPTTGNFLISTGTNSSHYTYESLPSFAFNSSAYSLRLDSYQCQSLYYYFL